MIFGNNLVTNGTFATDQTGWYESDANSTSWQATLGVDGTGCVRTIGDGTGDERFSTGIGEGGGATIKVVAGKRYYLSGNMYQTVAASRARMRLLWYTDSALISTENYITITPIAAWSFASGIFVAPATATRVRIDCYILDAATSEVRFDNISLQEIKYTEPSPSERLATEQASASIEEITALGVKYADRSIAYSDDIMPPDMYLAYKQPEFASAPEMPGDTPPDVSITTIVPGVLAELKTQY